MSASFDSFRARLTATIGLLAVAVASATLFYIDKVESARIVDAQGRSLKATATHIAGFLAENLRERDREMSLLAESLPDQGLDSPALRKTLERLKRTYPYYAWVGVADIEGIVHAAADGVLQGENVARRPWFAQGARGAYIGDVHEAVLLASKLPNPKPSEPLRFIDFAAPILDTDGRLRGVLASHASWAWVEEVIDEALRHDVGTGGVEAFIVSKAGNILYPYAAIGKVALPAMPAGDQAYAILDWPGGEAFLTASVGIRESTATALGWRIVIRQPMDKAVAPVAALHRTLLLAGVVATVLFILLGRRMAGSLSQPVEDLAAVAQRIAQGDEASSFSSRSRIREIVHLSGALRAMTGKLTARQRDLAEKNAFAAATMDAIAARLCVLAPGATVIAANAAWRGDDRSSAPPELGAGDCAIGTNYLAACDAAAEAGVEAAASIADGVRAVLDGQRESFTLEYAGPASAEKPSTTTWFKLTVTPFCGARRNVVLKHEDVSAQKRQEEALREALDLLSLAERSAGAGSWSWDLHSGVLNWTDAMFHLFGLDPATTLASFATWHAVVVAEDLPAAEAAIATSIEHRQPFATSYRIKLPGGGIRWIDAHGHLTCDADGTPLRFSGICLDASARKAGEALLVDSEERFRSLFEHLPIAYQSLDDRGCWLDANQKMADLLGFDSPAQLRGRSIAEHWEADNPTAFPAAFAEFMRTDRNKAEIRLRRHDGRPVSVLIAGRVQRGPHGEFLRTHCVVTDISERQAMEDKIRELNADLERKVAERTRELDDALAEVRLATEAAAIGIWSWDFTDNHLEWDARMCELYGLAPEDGHSGLCYNNWRSRVHPDDLPELERTLAEAREHLTGWSGVFRVVLPDHTRRFIHAASVVQYDEAGQPLRMVGINRDVTLEREIEITLKAARNAADAANNMKSEFLANVTHEIRTPLNAVLGLTGLTLETELNDTQRHYLRTVQNSARSLLRLMNDILDLSKIEAGQLEILPQPFDMRALVQDVADLFSASLMEKGLSFRATVADEVPGRLLGDDLRLRQVLVNLIGNALKFTERGAIDVELRVVGQAAESVDLHVAVSDTGIGMSPQQVARLFERFSQADASISRRYGGTGLGLFISERLIELMGGRMEVSSEPGVGTRFSFTLTLRPVHTSDAPTANPPTPASGALPAPGADQAAAAGPERPVDREALDPLLDRLDEMLAMNMLSARTLSDEIEALVKGSALEPLFQPVRQAAAKLRFDDARALLAHCRPDQEKA